MAEAGANSGDPQVLITAELIERLRARHIRMYERRLESGSPAVIVSETQALLVLWRGMAGKSWLLLSEAEEREVVDALAAEDWEFDWDGEGEVMWVRAPVEAVSRG